MSFVDRSFPSRTFLRLFDDGQIEQRAHVFAYVKPVQSIRLETINADRRSACFAEVNRSDIAFWQSRAHRCKCVVIAHQINVVEIRTFQFVNTNQLWIK
jgi:hypothetical protein